MFDYHYKEKHCSIGVKDQKWVGINEDPNKGCYRRDPFKKVVLHRDDIKGYTRDKGVCRNAENTKKWNNQAYQGQQPSIEECERRCNRMKDCGMFDYNYKEKHCSIGVKG